MISGADAFQVSIGKIVQHDLLTQIEDAAFILSESALYIVFMAVDLIGDPVKGIMGKL